VPTYNFNGGPAAIPLAVLQKTQRDLLDFEGTGISILETSFRSPPYLALHDRTVALLRNLYGVPETHRVLLLQGSASQQFAMIPMNFLPHGASADYLLTGFFSRLAYDEAQTIGNVRVAATAGANGLWMPDDELDLDDRAAYAHATLNNTSEGTEFARPPDTGHVPLIADMSSNFFSRRINMEKYGLIYAGGQKNLGPSGMVVVIVKNDLIARGRSDIPAIWQYRVHAETNSLYHTPPGFSIYLLHNFLSWAESIGGLVQLEAWNAEKSRLLYAIVDRFPDFYRCLVAPEIRSRMNVVFRLPTELLEQQFLSEAERANMIGLTNHPAVGGLRVSLYNGVELEAVERLCDFMESFALGHQPAERQRYTAELHG